MTLDIVTDDDLTKAQLMRAENGPPESISWTEEEREELKRLVSEGLTDRQALVWLYRKKGLSYRAVGAHMVMSSASAHQHANAAYKKLQKLSTQREKG